MTNSVRPDAYLCHHKDGKARFGSFNTIRGRIRTPAFMPVGTAGTVKGLYNQQVKSAGSDVILANTYHLMLRPGAERVAAMGGLHQFMGWPHPILTDSGGFQVMSLSKLREITEDGATFQSHIDGSTHHLTPERSIEIQCLLGADILMQFDECIELPAKQDEVKRAMELSLRWAERSKRSYIDWGTHGQSLFAIVQGGVDPKLREASAKALVATGFGGYAIGGLAVGEGRDAMLRTLDVTVPHLPETQARYLMGVGTPVDIIEAVARGIDMFDCVLPTRNGRHGLAYTWNGKINLKNACYAEDTAPIDPLSTCPASRDYSKAYLHHLIKSGEMLGAMLVSWANIAFYQDLMRAMRDAISAGQFQSWAEETKARLTENETQPVA